MLADRGYDAEWFRDALEKKGIKSCRPGRKSRSFPVKYDKRPYKRRNRIEIMFGRLKDWRCIATRYDRCPTTFFGAITLESDEPLGRQIVTMLDVALRGIGNRWNDVVLPGFDYLVIENTLVKRGRQVETLNRLPIHAQPLVGAR